MVIIPEMINDKKVDEKFKLSVYSSEKRVDLFIINPVGSINTNSYPILQKELEWILESRPEIILFDMKEVFYINFRGLRVILKTIIEMKKRNGKVYITNIQPRVMEMIEIMNGILPKWVSGYQKQLENYLDANHDNSSADSQVTQSCDHEKAYKLAS